MDSFNEFNQLNENEIKEIVENKLKGNNTIVYAFDGTRRSYLIETIGNIEKGGDEFIKIIDSNEYSKNAIKKFLYDIVMMCKHGIKNIVFPMWFNTLIKRGPIYFDKYMKGIDGFGQLLDDNELSSLYKEMGIRVIFYGDHNKLFEKSKCFETMKKFQQIMDLTQDNSNHYVLIGTTAVDEPSEIIIDLSFEFLKSNGNIKPTPKQLSKLYYCGVDVDPVSIYIGFDRFSTDGRPLFISDTGNEDLYYTVSPHKYLSKTTFRKILYDKIYTRKVSNPGDYILKIEDIKKMRQFYIENADVVMGVGKINSQGNYWYPSDHPILNFK